MNFKSTTEFQKDFKKLSKKFRSLSGDLVEFKKVLSEAPLGIGKHFNVITKTDHLYIIKARFFCKSLKKKDLRIIYAYMAADINFIEMYFKGDKENEDRERIKKHLKNFS
ncbi:MAG: hypothetical protein ABIG90_02535 [bacterium]